MRRIWIYNLNVLTTLPRSIERLAVTRSNFTVSILLFSRCCSMEASRWIIDCDGTQQSQAIYSLVRPQFSRRKIKLE
ncbi:hypothetical protein NCHU2750_36660 [Neorhizobium sp. NCHU2750]|nr:hypothetical protein NCHU2750_36660 [Neorhizobium sp. NCHU2750]